jgi:hypothetical protein
MRTDVYTGAPINFGDLAQYLTYASSTAGVQFLLRVILFLRILLGERIARELVLRYIKLTSLLSTVRMHGIDMFHNKLSVYIVLHDFCPGKQTMTYI